MNSVDQIISHIKNEMMLFEKHFKETMHSKVPLLDKITNYVVKRKGKQMRPMFVFLSAKMLGELNEKTFDAAVLVELLHTATLVHDDVVDDAEGVIFRLMRFGKIKLRYLLVIICFQEFYCFRWKKKIPIY